MRLILLLCLLAAKTPDPAEAILARVEAAYRDMPALRMRFEQTSTGPSYFQPLVQTGRLQLERPASVRWEFEQPTERAWISDGETLWMVEAADRTVQVVRPVDATVRRTLALVSGLQGVRARFELSVEAGVLVLIPKDKTEPLRRVEVTVDDRGIITAVTLVDPFGDRTALALRDVERLPDLPDAAFRFEPPPGWTVVGP